MRLQPQEETGDAVCEFDAQLLKRALSNIIVLVKHRAAQESA